MELNLIPSGLKDVKIINFQEENGYLKVTLEKISSSAICPACKTPSTSIKDHHVHRIIAKPIESAFIKLFVNKRRFFCLNSSCSVKSFTEEIEGLPKKHVYTTEFENFLTHLSAYMDYPTIRKHLTQYHLFLSLGTIAQKLKNKLPQFQIAFKDIQNAKYIGIDEFSYAKGHSYGVIAVNIDKHKIADMVAGGRDQKTAEAALSIFNPSTVSACCIDMYEPFKLACQNKFPNADIVIDKFHAIKLLNEAIKDLIKRILPNMGFTNAQQKEFNKSGKWIVLSAKEKLTDSQRAKLPQLLALNTELKTIYEFKESFRDIYRLSKDYNIAHQQFHYWLNHAKASGIPELIHVANTYSDWIIFILNYWHHRISNGIVEGKVNKIKVFRRKAYHFKNFHSLRYQVMKSEQFNFRK